MALFADLRNIQRNTKDGIHAASLGGCWQVLVKGFGGMRLKREMLTFDPKLPIQIKHLKFSIKWRECKVIVSIEHEKIKLLFKSVTRKNVRIIVYRKVVELPCNKTVTFYKKGR